MTKFAVAAGCTAMLLLGVLSSVSAAPQAASGQPAAPASSVYQSVYDGWKWWHVYCYRCHGVDALGTTTAPSMIDPARKLSRAEFMRIVSNGIPDTAMQAWNKLLDDKQIGELQLYVRARTENVLPPGRPDEVGPNKGRWVPPSGWPGR